MIGVEIGDSQWIAENSRCLFKRHTVLGEVSDRFVSNPLKLHNAHDKLVLRTEQPRRRFRTVRAAVSVTEFFPAIMARPWIQGLGVGARPRWLASGAAAGSAVVVAWPLVVLF